MPVLGSGLGPVEGVGGKVGGEHREVGGGVGCGWGVGSQQPPLAGCGGSEVTGIIKEAIC